MLPDNNTLGYKFDSLLMGDDSEKNRELNNNSDFEDFERGSEFFSPNFAYVNQHKPLGEYFTEYVENKDS